MAKSQQSRARICTVNLLRSPGIDSQPRDGTTIRARIFNVYGAQDSIPRNEFRQSM